VSEGGNRRLLNPDFLPSTILGSESMRCSPAIAFNHNHAGRPPPLGLSFWLHQAASSGVDRQEAVIRVSRNILGQAQAQPAEGRCQPRLCSPSLLSTSHHGVGSRLLHLGSTSGFVAFRMTSVFKQHHAAHRLLPLFRIVFPSIITPPRSLGHTFSKQHQQLNLAGAHSESLQHRQQRTPAH